MAVVMQIDSDLNISLLSTKHTEAPAITPEEQIDETRSIDDEDVISTGDGTDEFLALLLGIASNGLPLDNIKLTKHGALGAKHLEENAINPSFNNLDEINDDFSIEDETQLNTLNGIELLFVELIGLTNEGTPLEKIIMTKDTINTPRQIIEGGL